MASGTIYPADLIQLKHQIIGHPQRKLELFSQPLCQDIIALLDSDDLGLAIPSTIIIGSLAHGGERISQSLLERGLIPQLLSNLNGPRNLISPSLKALRTLTMYQSHENQHVFQPNILARLKALLFEFTSSISTILANCTTNRDHQRLLSDSNIIETLLECLRNHERAVLKALCAASLENMTISMSIASRELPYIIALQKSPDPEVQLSAVNLVANLYQQACIPASYRKRLLDTSIPILVRLFEMGDAPMVLSKLISQGEDLQKAAFASGVIDKLNILLSNSLGSPRRYESALNLTATLSLTLDTHRKAVISAGLIPHIISSFQHPDAKVRAAAAFATRSLSRSVCILRTSLVDAGIAGPLFKLLNDSDETVQVQATAAVCNMVLEFSPMKKIIMDQGILPVLGKHALSMNPELRTNACWAIKHLVYNAEIDTKKMVIEAMDLAFLLQLCNDGVPNVEEQALEIIRNIASGGSPSVDLILRSEQDSRNIFDLLLRKLASNLDQLISPAIYIVVHIAAGNASQQQFLFQDDNILIKSLVQFLDSSDKDIRLGVVWTIINLTHSEENTDYMESARSARILNEFGFLSKLVKMKDDRIMDIRERVKNAITQFSMQGIAESQAIEVDETMVND